MSRELFIYWRVAPHALAEAVSAIQAWQAGLRVRHPGLQTRLYRRSDTAESDATVMETYALQGAEQIDGALPLADGIDDALHRAIVEQGAGVAAPWCLGTRHVEVFEPLAP